jgi:hypothetical protein
MAIENEKQLNIAQDFEKWVKEHNARVVAEKFSFFDVAFELSKLNERLLMVLMGKQYEINDLKAKIDELEREIRVDKDLLKIARFIDDSK